MVTPATSEKRLERKGSAFLLQQLFADAEILENMP